MAMFYLAILFCILIMVAFDWFDVSCHVLVVCKVLCLVSTIPLPFCRFAVPVT